MKPIKLVINAFGSYGTKQEIDFTKAGENLFLITGDTGSGKSTIFDAIVFALFGEASSESNKKDGEELQSHFGEFGSEAYVELTFSEKGDNYTVRRSPRQYKKNKKGVINKTLESAKVSLIMPDGSEYAEKNKDEYIVSLIGLTKSQFMQVAMIAQGEFVDVIRKPTTEKKPVYRQVFNTEIYEKVVNETKNRLDANKAEFAGTEQFFKNEIGGLDVPDECSEAVNIRLLKREIVSSKEWDTTKLERLIELLGTAKEELDAIKKEVDKRYQEAEAKFLEKNNEYVMAEGLTKDFDNLETSEIEMNNCEAKQKEINEKVKLIEHIENAYEIKVAFDAYTSAKSQYVDNKDKYNKEKQSLPDKEEAYKAAGEEERVAKDNLDKANGAYTEISSQINEQIAKLNRITEAAKKMQAAQAEIEALEAQEKELNDKMTGLNTEETDNKAIEDANSNAEIDKTKLDNDKKSLKDMHDEVGNISNNYDKYIDNKKKIKDNQKQYGETSEKYKALEEEFSKKRRHYLDDQAGVLADELEEGKPCPVCGSTTHPGRIIVNWDEEQIDKAMLDDLEAELKSISETQSKLSETICSDIKVNDNIRTELVRNVNVLIDKLKAYEESCSLDAGEASSDAELKKIIEDINEVIGDNIKKNADNIKANAKSIDALIKARNALKALPEQKKEISSKLEDIASKKQEQLQAHTQANTIIETDKKDLKYDTVEAAKEKLKEVDENKQNAKSTYDTAKNNLDTRKSAKEKTETLIRNYEEQLPNLEETMNSAERSYQEKMAMLALSEAEWKKYVDEYPKDTKTIHSEIDEFNTHKAATKALYEAAKKATEGKTKPDMDSLKGLKDGAEKAKSELNAEKNGIDGFAHNCSKIYDSLKTKSMELEDIIKKKSQLERLYDRVAGKATNARMDLETYVLRYYLENIVEVAKDYFYDMTNGEFDLEMYDFEDASIGKNKGLDLVARSNENGMTQDINMLSGGESFKAAVALALGMAETMQAKSAAVNLDMLFIDEGFGSLDDESRRKALDALKKMAGGSKLIGIISHVTELKQQIDNKLVVTKEACGSTVRWENN